MIIARGDEAGVAGALQSMVSALGHRGPDDHGCALARSGDWVIGIGHTRLSIIDLSARGAQPMLSEDRSRILTYNGEVYNFLDLREELRAEGVRFASRCDTEVILRGYMRWDLELLPSLRGMFAFGIWDGDARKLVLARDALGIKPLYVYQTGNLFLFASEVRALFASGLVPRTLDPKGVASYLNFGSVSSPQTVIRNVRSLNRGECIEVFPGERLVVSESRFTPRTRVPDPPRDRKEATAALRDVLFDSVSRHLISDVPVALFLSGGIDSTAIAGLMSDHIRQKPLTFTIGFSEREYAEEVYAAKTAERFGTEHRQIVLSEKDMYDSLPAAISAMDQPTMDGINTWVVSKAVSEQGIKVALSGLGGDEMFGGYASFRRALLLQRVNKIPQSLRTIASATGRAFLDGAVSYRKFWDLLDSNDGALSAYSISRRLFSSDEVRALTGIDPPEPFLPAVNGDLINSVSMLETGGYMANTLLRDTDFMSMSHSLEVRVPFADMEVLQYVQRIPGAWKLEKERPKPLLLDALQGLVPDEIWRRPKMGFGLPFQKWMLSTLHHDIDGVLRADGPIRAAGISGSAATAVWQRFQNSPRRERWSRPWSLYILQKWCEVNEVAA